MNILNRIIRKYAIIKAKKKFAKIGDQVSFSPLDSFFTYENIYVGNNVCIGYNADFVASRSNIIIGDHVIFAPKVSIRGGDHRIDIVGKFLDEVKDEDKLDCNDADVIFEGDNWIGMNVTILKGVTIGRGTIIGAGSIVTKSMPKYSICVGNPCKVIKRRFTEEQIFEHEKKLFAE